MSNQIAYNIRFGPFILETASRRLMREGRRVRVSPIELKLLETLLRNQDRVLTGDELRVLVWADDPSTGVAPAGDANSLYVAVRKLRKSLGTYGKWIVNLPKVGYTVSEEVEVESDLAQGTIASDYGPPFVGRQAELGKLKHLLTRSRLVTLTGPPGIGKTRLASRLADEIAVSYPDGVVSVNFVPIESEGLVPKAVLSVLGLTEQAHVTDLEVISEHLKDKRTLILLDNCEHLVDACSQLADHLLRTAPAIQVVATSRESLLIAGESVMEVPPLSIPSADAEASSNGSGRSEAVELFMTLVKQHRSDLEIEEKEMTLVGELCRRLEGIPLAIELAAVQVGAYTVEQIVEGTSDRFRLLRRRGGEDVRHKTLEDAIDWSYSLLTEEERSFLRRLSVFSGQWTCETATAICADEGVSELDVVHRLARLVRQSLIQLTAENGGDRYTMLDTIRQFGRNRLRGSGEEDLLYSWHDKYFLDLVENAFEAGAKGDWLPRLEAEYDNVRSVLERSIRRGRDIETGLRLCGALSKFWFNYGHTREAKWWTKLALESDDGRFPVASAKALRTAGFFFGQTAGSGEDSELGKAYFEQSLALWRELGDKKEEAFTLCHYSFLLNRLGLFDDARRAAQQSFDIGAAAGDHANISRSVNNLALTLLDVGEAVEAKPVFEVALSEALIAEDTFLEAVCLNNLGEAAVHMGELEYAEEYLADSLALLRSIAHRPLVARVLLLQGEVATLKSQTSEALDLERTALEEFLEMEDNQGIASALEAIALTHVQTDANPALFLTLNSAAAELRRAIKLQVAPVRKGPLQRLRKLAIATLGKTAADTAIAVGRSMPMMEAVEMALTAD